MADRILHGVNLTGWLALEPWVTPELFAEAGALDEASLARTLGPERYGALVREHRTRFIRRQDLVKIASRGFNAVRVVVPWYVYGSDGPEPGARVGCIELVDQLLEWAEDLGLLVVFVFGINPGVPALDPLSSAESLENRLDREELLAVVCALAQRYANRTGLFGIELADEVCVLCRRGLTISDGVPMHRLRNYYRTAYELVRNALGPDPVIILPDAGVPSRWGRFLAGSRDKNLWLDASMDHPRTGVDVSGPAGVRRLIDEMDRHLHAAERSGMQVMIGRWSSSLPLADSSMTPEGRKALERVYASEQLALYERCSAWFFNTWKTSGLLASWDARVALAAFERGMISA